MNFQIVAGPAPKLIAHVGGKDARVGAAKVRRAMTGVETSAVRFAGEAFSLPWHRTVHGAWTSGKDVAANPAESLSRAD